MKKESDVIVHMYSDEQNVLGKLSNTSTEEPGWFILTDSLTYDGGWHMESFDNNYGYKYAWHTGCYDSEYDFMLNYITKKKLKRNKLYKL